MFYECNGNGDCTTRARPLQGQQWGLEAIQAPQAWSIQKGSKAVKVGWCYYGRTSGISGGCQQDSGAMHVVAVW